MKPFFEKIEDSYQLFQIFSLNFLKKISRVSFKDWVLQHTNKLISNDISLDSQQHLPLESFNRPQQKITNNTDWWAVLLGETSLWLSLSASSSLCHRELSRLLSFSDYPSGNENNGFMWNGQMPGLGNSLSLEDPPLICPDGGAGLFVPPYLASMFCCIWGIPISCGMSLLDVMSAHPSSPTSLLSHPPPYSFSTASQLTPDDAP